MQNKRGGCLSGVVNLITAVLLLGTLLVAGLLAMAVAAPDQVSGILTFLQDTPTPENTPTQAAAASVPTLTPSLTPQLILPTWTPFAELPTITGMPTNTRRPTETPSVIPTFPSKTPTKTPTPTPTDTGTPTPIGPPPTASQTLAPFIFTKSDNSPYYLQNFANDAGCQWLGVAGEVLDLNRNPVPANSYVVHVWGNDVDVKLAVGSAPEYSPSGWAQTLFNSPIVRDYNVQLETPNGTAVSQVYAIQTRASCNQNLLKIDFVQNH